MASLRAVQAYYCTSQWEQHEGRFFRFFFSPEKAFEVTLKISRLETAYSETQNYQQKKQGGGGRKLFLAHLQPKLL